MPALKGHTGTIEVDPKQISWNYAGFNNPYFALENNGNRDERTRWIGGGSATYTLTPSVRAIARVGTDHWKQSRDFDIAPTWMGGFPTANGRGDFSGGGFQRQTITASETNAEFLLSDDIATSHPTDRAAAARSHAADRRLLAPIQQLRRVDHRARTCGRKRAGCLPPATKLSNDNTTESVFAMGEWAINDYASIAGTARNEWYSVLASGSNSAFYPSISGRIDLTRAAGMKSDDLNSAVVHAGLSRVGGAVSALLLTNIFTAPTDSAATVSASPSLSPEMTTSLELGGSLSFLRNRLGLDVTLYDDQTTGVILGVHHRRPLRCRQQRRHACRTRAWRWRPRSFRSARRRALEWSLDARLAKNSNNLDDVSGGSSAVLLGPPVYGLSVEARKGSPLGALVGTGFKRDGSGNLLLQNGLPVSDAQQRVLGTMSPDWSGSVGSNLHLGHLDVVRARGRENGRQHFQHDEPARDFLGKLRGNGIAPRQRPGVRGCRCRHRQTERGSRDDPGVLHGAVADSGSVDLRRQLREAPRSANQLLVAAAGADSVRRAERSGLADRKKPRDVEQGAEHRSRDGSEHDQLPGSGARTTALGSQSGAPISLTP